VNTGRKKPKSIFQSLLDTYSESACCIYPSKNTSKNTHDSILKMHTRHRGEAGPGTINYHVLGAISIRIITITLIIITCVSIIIMLSRIRIILLRLSRIRIILLRSVQIQIYFLVRFNLINSPRNHPVRNAALRLNVLHHMDKQVNDIANAIHFIKINLLGLLVPYLLHVCATNYVLRMLYVL
jgi:hypothetical protein